MAYRGASASSVHRVLPQCRVFGKKLSEFNEPFTGESSAERVSVSLPGARAGPQCGVCYGIGSSIDGSRYMGRDGPHSLSDVSVHTGINIAGKPRGAA